MKRLFSLVLCAFLAGAAFAATELSCVPQGTDMILSFDVEQIVKSPLFQRIKQRKMDAQAEAKLQAFANLTGVNPLEDIQRATLFGTPGDESSNVLHLRGRLDQQKLTTLVQAAPQYAESSVAGRKVHQWYDEKEKRLKYGTFLADGSVLIANRLERLEAALRAAAGGPGMSDGALPAGRDTAAAWALVMRPDAGRLGNQTLAAHQLTGVLNLSPSDVATRLVLAADTAEAAQKWLELARGALALLQLQQDNPAAAAVAAKAQVSPGAHQSVTLNVSATHDQFLDLIKKK